MSRWWGWTLNGVASCGSLLAASGWAQSTSAVVAAERGYFSWWVPLLVLLCVLLLWTGYHWRKVTSLFCRQSEPSLKHFQEQNQQMQYQLARQQASHGRLAHELSEALTQLTPQLATLQAIRDPILWQNADQVARGVGRVQGLLNQLIQITQSTQAAWFEYQPLILLAWLTPRLEPYRLQANARGIGWHIAMVPEIAVTLESQLLDHLLQMLFSQMLRSTPSGSTLHLAFFLDEQRNQLVFQIRGVCLAPDVTLMGEDDADTLAIRLLQQQVRQLGGELRGPGEAAGDEGWLVRLPCLWTRLNWPEPHQKALTLPLPANDAPLLRFEDDSELLQNRPPLQPWLQASLSLGVPTPQSVALDVFPIGELSPADRLFSEQLRTISRQLLHEDQISVERLADHFNISSRTLQRKLQSLFGVSYSDYVRKVQMQLVIEQLQRGASVKEAARVAGFRDQAYLTRVFRQNFAMSPSEYRKRQVPASDLA